MEQQYSDEIKKLAQDYYNRSLSLEEYRRQRDKLIDQMDREYNGISMGS